MLFSVNKYKILFRSEVTFLNTLPELKMKTRLTEELMEIMEFM
jgi:acyl-[acyl carrier protein]--UDP-N-acetylglucosamine O-acyltransferase